jgi:hypothetical protein
MDRALLDACMHGTGVYRTYTSAVPEPAAEPLTLEKMLATVEEIMGRRKQQQARVAPSPWPWLDTRSFLLYRQPRPPEKPFRSRPRRTYVRAKWQPIRAERVRIRGQTLVSWRGWKGRKVPNRTGYPPNSVFLFNPSSVFLYPGAAA